jgi:sec-independent protein translocase protein TatA
VNVGVPELVIVLAIVLLLFGSKKLPGLARSLGQATREFRKGTEDDSPENDSADPDAGSQA